MFDRRHVIQTIVDHHPNTWTADQIETLADAWLATAAVIPLGTERTGETIGHRTGRVELAGQLPRYTTPEILTAEHRVLTAFDQPATHRPVDPDLVTTAIERWQTSTGHRLGRDQAHMVRITTGPDRFGLVLGAAGAGKTTALEVAATAWTTDDRLVIGAAVNGTAAEVLGDTTGIPTTTLASLLTRLDTTTHPLLDADTVVVVDEASTIGTRDLARLVSHVDRVGATLRLVGDPHQHGAVEAGGLFAHLVRTHETRTPTLTANRRQAASHMSDVRDAVAAYRDGDRSHALRTLDDTGRINTGDAVLERLVADWYQDHLCGAEASRMIAEHHHTRRELNDQAQALLRADGTLTGPGVRIGEETFHVGDRVIARAQNRHLRPAGAGRRGYVRNGNTGTITAILDPDGPAPSVVVDFDGKGHVHVPHDWLSEQLRPGLLGGLTPAYAVTSHAAQGATFHAGRMVATERSTPEAVYVGLTRGRNDTRLYLPTPTPAGHDTDPDLPRITPHPDALDALDDRLNRPGAPTLATLHHPNHTPTARLEALLGRPTGELAAQHRHLRLATLPGHRPTLAVRTRRTHLDALETALDERVTRAVDHPSPLLTRVLGPRPTNPDQLPAWQAAARRVETHRHFTLGLDPTTAAVPQASPELQLLGPQGAEHLLAGPPTPLSLHLER